MNKLMWLGSDLFVALLAFSTLIPFLWMLSTSLKTDLEVYTSAPSTRRTILTKWLLS